jgi:hypothetical protein
MHKLVHPVLHKIKIKGLVKFIYNETTAFLYGHINLWNTRGIADPMEQRISLKVYYISAHMKSDKDRLWNRVICWSKAVLMRVPK